MDQPCKLPPHSPFLGWALMDNTINTWESEMAANHSRRTLTFQEWSKVVADDVGNTKDFE